MPQTTVSLTAPEPAARQFTARDEFKAVFDTALDSVTPDRHSVLMFYGVGGIGKSALIRELRRRRRKRGDGAERAADAECPEQPHRPCTSARAALASSSSTSAFARGAACRPAPGGARPRGIHRPREPPPDDGARPRASRCCVRKHLPALA